MAHVNRKVNANWRIHVVNKYVDKRIKPINAQAAAILGMQLNENPVGRIVRGDIAENGTKTFTIQRIAPNYGPQIQISSARLFELFDINMPQAGGRTRRRKTHRRKSRRRSLA